GEEENTLPNTMYITEDMASDLFGKKGKKINKTLNKIDKKGIPKSFSVNASVKFKVEKTSEVIQSENVLGFIKGTDLSNEIVVVSAHYDHIGFNDEEIFNGADDDGSGTVAVLEIAEAMSKAAKLGKGPRRSILFLTVSGEEKGLLGSEYFADIEPVFPLESIVTDLNIDMVGRIDPEHEGDREYVYTIGSDFLSSDLHKISESVAAEYSDIKLDYRYNSTDDPNRFYYRSDHYNFAKHNIPVIFYFNGTHEDYHGAGDTVDKIQFDILEKRAKLVFHTLWEVANTDKAPEVDRVLEE
ncbi:MAG: Zn-dependent M28 family amino/carboxypeptidase, partial [Limisphaerales bacterium]